MDKALKLLLSLVLLPLSCKAQVMQQAIINSKPAASSPCASPASDTFAGTTGTALATHNSCWSNANATYVVSSWQLNGSSAVKITSQFGSAGAIYNNTSDTSSLVIKQATATHYNTTTVAVRMTLNTHLGYSAGFTGAISGGNLGTVTLNKDNGFFNACFGTWSATADHTIKIVASGTSTTSINISVDGVACGSTFTDSSSPLTSGSPGFYATGDNTSTSDTINGPWQDS